MPDRVIVKGEIGNALHSIAPDHITGVADDIFDEGMQMYQSEINSSSLVYDISANHLVNGNPSTYDDLADALGVDGANIPEAIRKGGMSVKFVHTSDNKYIQARCMAQNFTTDVTQWQGVDENVTNGSKNLVESGAVDEKTGNKYSASIQGSSHSKILDLSAKSGDKIRIKVSGTKEAARLIIRADSATGTTLIDYAQPDKEYLITLNGNISSLWLWANGDYNLQFDITTGITMSIGQINDQMEHEHTGVYSYNYVSSDNTTHVKEIVPSINISQGDKFYVLVSGTVGNRLILRGNRYNGETGTVTIVDNIVSGILYSCVASTDIYSLGIWNNGISDITISIFTETSKDIVENILSTINNKSFRSGEKISNTDIATEVAVGNNGLLKSDTVAKITGNHYTVSKSGDSSVKILDLVQYNGDEISITLTGSVASDGQRLIIRANSASGTTLIDYALRGLTYNVKLTEDITSLWLWADRAYDLIFNVNTGIVRKVDAVANRVESTDTGMYSTHFIHTGTDTYQGLLVYPFSVKQGDKLYFYIKGSVSGRLILRANLSISSTTLITIQDNIVSGTMYSYTAETDLNNLAVWSNNNVDCDIFVYTNSSREVLDIVMQNKGTIDGMLPSVEKIGFNKTEHVTAAVPSGASNGTALVFDNLQIREGDRFSISALGYFPQYTRLIIRANSASANTLVDYMQTYYWYDVVAPTDITSLYIWFNRDIDIDVIISSGMSSELNKWDSFKTTPHHYLGSGITESMSYKPFGALTKAYICFSTDDGKLGLGSYTLPMMLQKEVPFTAAIFSNCDALLNTDYRALILSAYNNGVLNIAQHDEYTWDLMSEGELYEFINSEKQAFSNMGVTVKGACIPGHRTNALIEAVFGEEYGAVRCGYDGKNQHEQPAYRTIYVREVDYSVSPARANMYCLGSTNIKDNSLAKWKQIIDYAVSNKMFVSVHMHDNDFVETAENYQSNRALLEAVIDYAKTVNIEFTTIGDLPRIY